MNDINLYKDLPLIETAGSKLTEQERLKALNEPLLFWFQSHKRILPWRENVTPYRVWVSEIMLQQTRVEAVKPYFERFLAQLPDVAALSKVSDEVLMKLWEGLGYYNRGRNLKRAAEVLVAEYDGELPGSYEELLTLPGIGSYTAGAVASIAFGIPVPAVDGNVLRVISRVLGSYDDILKQSVKKSMEQKLLKAMPKDAAGDYNQALMEIGAVVCIPNGQPKCRECPLSGLCLAKKQKLTEVIPVKTKKKPRRKEQHTILMIEQKDRIAIQKRPDSGLLSGLYEFPNLDGHLTKDQVAELIAEQGAISGEIIKLPSSKHIFSHVEWDMIAFRVCLDSGFPGNYLMIEKEKVKSEYPVPSAYKAYLKILEAEG